MGWDGSRNIVADIPGLSLLAASHGNTAVRALEGKCFMATLA